MITSMADPSPTSTSASAGVCPEPLNAQQAAAVAQGLERPAGGDGPGPVLLLAGAGTGKTLTLAARVAALVQAGADPGRVLLLSFSRRAAASLERRVGLRLHQALGLPASLPAPRLPWCGTFHSVAARLLRLHAGALGLSAGFTVIDRADSQELMGQAREELGLHRSGVRFPTAATCLALHGRVLNAGRPLAAVVEAELPWCTHAVDELKLLFRRFATLKHEQQLLDYDDLLLFWQLMMEEPALAATLQARFDHVLVDEYQDTNVLQQQIVLRLRPAGRGLVVVGDDAQAIYAFRGASVRGMLDFPTAFEPPAQVLRLEQNYRSSPQILAASNAVIEHATEGLRKRLWSLRPDAARPRLVNVLDEAEQARWVALEVLRQREEGLPLKRQAVLFRTASHSAALELELVRRNIPFVKFGGLRFLEAAHVKDVVSVLRWVQNPRSRLAALRVARLVPGIGPTRARQVADAVAGAALPATPLQALQAFRVPAPAAVEWAALVAAWADIEAAPWPDALSRAVRWYAPHLQRLHEDARTRQADLDQLVQLASAFGSRERFLAELTLDPPEATSDEAGPPHRDEDYLILSTIHSAKGQEWSAVTVLNVVDGCMPSDMATGHAAEIEEERRLLYVAMTRARDLLTLMVPQRFHVSQQRHLGDRHLYAAASRFVPPEVAALFDDVGAGWGGDAAEATADRPAPGQAQDQEHGAPLIDVASLARARWS